MTNRLHSLWFDLQGSLWFFPSVITFSAALVAFLSVTLDLQLQLQHQAWGGWFFGGGAEGARGVLSAIAGTMVTVIALVFSITVVALQLASSQLTPRVLRSFMADRGNQIVLGFFIGTFIYSLLVMRAVRAPLDQDGGFVPALSVSVAIGLSLFSVALLIYFIHHSANSMRVSVVVNRVAVMTLDLANQVYSVAETEPPTASLNHHEETAVIWADAAGYLQTIDDEALLDLAAEHHLTIRVHPCVGDFVLQGTAVAGVVPTPDEETADAIRAAVDLGPERTAQADVEFGIVQLADIALKALSPGINDPHTAMTCVDRLAEVLVAIAKLTPEDDYRVRTKEAGRVVLPGPPFDRLVRVAFGRIRHYGAGDAASVQHLVATLGRMATLIPPGAREPLAREARAAVEEARQIILVDEDMEMVSRAATWAYRGTPTLVKRVATVITR